MFLNADKYGLKIDKSAITYDMKEIIKRKDGVVKQLTGGVSFYLRKTKLMFLMVMVKYYHQLKLKLIMKH